MMRSVAFALLSLMALGCGEREALSPHDFAPAARAVPAECTSATLARDPVEEIETPVPLELIEPAEAPERRTRLSQTVSLGYAGDGQLTQIHRRDNMWGDDERYYGGVVYGYGYSRNARGSASSVGFGGYGNNLRPATQFRTPGSSGRVAGSRPGTGRPSGGARGPR